MLMFVSYRVEAKHEHRNGVTRVSFIRYLDVKVNGVTYTLAPGGDLLVILRGQTNIFIVSRKKKQSRNFHLRITFVYRKTDEHVTSCFFFFAEFPDV